MWWTGLEQTEIFSSKVNTKAKCYQRWGCWLGRLVESRREKALNAPEAERACAELLITLELKPARQLRVWINRTQMVIEIQR